MAKIDLPGWAQGVTEAPDGTLRGYNYSGSFGNIYKDEDNRWNFRDESVAEAPISLPETKTDKPEYYYGDYLKRFSDLGINEDQFQRLIGSGFVKKGADYHDMVTGSLTWLGKSLMADATSEEHGYEIMLNHPGDGSWNYDPGTGFQDVQTKEAGSGTGSSPLEGFRPSLLGGEGVDVNPNQIIRGLTNDLIQKGIEGITGKKGAPTILDYIPNLINQAPTNKKDMLIASAGDLTSLLDPRDTTTDADAWVQQEQVIKDKAGFGIVRQQDRPPKPIDIADNKDILKQNLSDAISGAPGAIADNPNQLLQRISRGVGDELTGGLIGNKAVTGLPSNVTFDPNFSGAKGWKITNVLPESIRPQAKGYGAPINNIGTAKMYQDTNMFTRGSPIGTKQGNFYIRDIPEQTRLQRMSIKNPLGSKVSRGFTGAAEVQLPHGTPGILSSADEVAEVATKAAAGKGLRKFGARAIPLAGTVLGAWDVGTRIGKGDWRGAALGGLSMVPGPLGWSGLIGQASHDALRAREQRNAASQALQDSQSASPQADYNLETPQEGWTYESYMSMLNDIADQAASQAEPIEKQIAEYGPTGTKTYIDEYGQRNTPLGLIDARSAITEARNNAEQALHQKWEAYNNQWNPIGETDVKQTITNSWANQAPAETRFEFTGEGTKKFTENLWGINPGELAKSSGGGTFAGKYANFGHA